jgi:diguanylate cyclase (GGDEF)-like protein
VRWRGNRNKPRGKLQRRQQSTFRVDEHPDYKPLPRDRCTLTMLTGPTPGVIHTLSTGELMLGRDEELPWRIEDRGISSRHARVLSQHGEFVLEDLDSTNGTYLNGHLLERPNKLRDGDRIQLGENTLLRVSLQDATEQEAVRRMYRAAVLDPLTGIYNRGHLDTILVAEFAYAARHKIALAVLFVDLDFFTAINNTHGHQAGDAVLKAIAQTIRHAIRTEDLAARYGGEEFVLVARGIDLNGALVMAERTRRTIEELAVPFHGKTLKVTASIGVASFEAATPYTTPEQLVAAADRAVYRAKADGRNCVRGEVELAPESWRR